MDKTGYSSMIGALESKLSDLKEEGHDVFNQADAAIGMCLQTCSEIQSHVQENGFDSDEEEIYFFKNIKPRICSKISFYRKLAIIESHRPKSTRAIQIEYLQKEIFKLHIYFDDHKDFIKYYRSGQTIFDDKYFMRNMKASLLGRHNYDYLLDTQFSTVYDKTLSVIIAYENLEKYLSNEIRKLERAAVDPQFEEPEYVWTGKLTWLAELIYGLLATGVINNGNVSVKKLIKLFSRIFRLPSKDVYNAYRSVYSRKTKQLIYIERMREALLNKINDKYI